MKYFLDHICCDGCLNNIKNPSIILKSRYVTNNLNTLVG